MTLTYGLREFHIESWVDGQVERYGAVAAEGRLQHPGVVSRDSVVCTLPVEGVALTDGLREFFVESWVNGQVER
ncbi:MAG: hypothetical protein AB7S48_16870, partial [Bacteroidales bacterium]